MDLKCLSYFVAVVEAGSLGRASIRLRIAQPALGWQIRKLEEELGLELMTRHSRGVEPTEAGLRLLGHARAILTRTQEAVAELRSLTDEAQGTIVLGMTPSVNALLTVPLLKRLSAEAPQIRIRPVEELSAVLSEWVANGRLDIAIGFPVTELDGLCCEPLLGESHYFIEKVSPGAPAGGTIPFADAVGHDLVMTIMSSRWQRFLEEAAIARGRSLNVVHRMQSVATLRELVMQGVAATILPLGCVAREVAGGALRARRIVDPEINRDIVLQRADARPGTKAERVVCDMIRQLVAETMANSPGFWVPAQTGAVAPFSAVGQSTPRHAPSPSPRPLSPVDRTAQRAGRAERSPSFDDLLRV